MQPILAALKGLDDRGELTAWSVCAMPVVEPGFMFGSAGDELFATRRHSARNRMGCFDNQEPFR